MVRTRKRNYGGICADASGEEDREGTKKKKQMAVVEKERILPYLPVETWFSVLAFIFRAQVVRHTALTCRKFSRAAEIRLHRKCPAEFPHSKNVRIMRPLKIDYEEVKKPRGRPELKTVMLSRGQEIGWPGGPVPSNIVGFASIQIRDFDDPALAFFHQIQPLLDKGVHFSFDEWTACPDYIWALKRVLPLCAGQILSASVHLKRFPRIVTKFPLLLNKCQVLEVIPLWHSMDNLFEIPDLVEWLSKPREGGQPKLLIFEGRSTVCANFIVQIRKKFRFSIALSSPFLIRIKAYFGDGWTWSEFSEKNLRTGEQLSLSLGTINEGSRNLLLARWPLADAESAEFSAQKQKLLNWSRPKEGVLEFW